MSTDQQQRYAAIFNYLEQTHLHYLVGFRFVASGIRIGRQPYPILKMEWVEGRPLHIYIRDHLSNGYALDALAVRWVEMTSALRKTGLAHGDLQHGNILVVNGDFRLVDYDGMYVPSLARLLSNEIGHRNYQHPDRTERDFGPYLDNYSAWVIYISLVALSVAPALWQEFQGGDECLLFRKADLEDPDHSRLFGALDRLQDDRVRLAVDLFRSLRFFPLDQIPALDGEGFPASPLQPANQPAPSWITDYVSQGPASPIPDGSVPLATSVPAVPRLDPSWIFDSHPAQSQAPFAFSGPVGFQRLLLGMSAPALLAAVVLAASALSTTGVALLVAFVVILVNYVAWRVGYRSEPRLAELGRLRGDLATAEAELRAAQDRIEELHRRKKDTTKQSSEQQKQLSRDRQLLESRETGEVKQLEMKLQTTLSAINSRRKALDREEADELRAIDTSIGRRVSALAAQISANNGAEANEVASKLKKVQDAYLSNWLRHYRLESAVIPGIGPGFKVRLVRAGVFTAADIDGRILGIPRIGPTRQAALTTWKAQLTALAQRGMPSALPAAEVTAIAAKYLAQRSDLERERTVAEQQYVRSRAEVSARYRHPREAMGRQQAQAVEASQATIAAVRQRYSEQYRLLQESQAKLAEDLKRSISEKENSASEVRRNFFGLHWKREKLRRELARFQTLTFRNYVRRLVWNA